MDEIRKILDRYVEVDIDKELSSMESMKFFSTGFYRDVAEIYDVITGIKNIDRNPSGFDVNDAAILGLLVRIWKIFKEIVRYYDQNNAQMLSLLDRSFIESAVMAKYLMTAESSVIEDYRKCSYKNRIKILTDKTRSPKFFKTPAGLRLKKSVMEKLKAEGLTVDSFDEQKKNRWRVGGKSFYEIFSELENPSDYKHVYGVPSESIHGSWNESMDFDLIRNTDGTFSPSSPYQETDIRFVTPLLIIANPAYLMWLRRISAEIDNISRFFEWIYSVNCKLLLAFDELCKKPGDGPITQFS